MMGVASGVDAAADNAASAPDAGNAGSAGDRIVTAAGTGDAASGLSCADICALGLSARLLEELEFAVVVPVGWSSLPHAPINGQTDAAIMTAAKRLRFSAGAGFDTTVITLSPAWEGLARACVCRGQRCSSLIADLCKFCE
jgi:hypothetical protein